LHQAVSTQRSGDRWRPLANAFEFIDY